MFDNDDVVLNVNDECAICLEPLDKSTFVLPCLHGFHRACFEKCVQSECPLCRTPLPELTPLEMGRNDNTYTILRFIMTMVFVSTLLGLMLTYHFDDSN